MFFNSSEQKKIDVALKNRVKRGKWLLKTYLCNFPVGRYESKEYGIIKVERREDGIGYLQTRVRTFLPPQEWTLVFHTESAGFSTRLKTYLPGQWEACVIANLGEARRRLFAETYGKLGLIPEDFLDDIRTEEEAAQEDLNAWLEQYRKATLKKLAQGEPI